MNEAGDHAKCPACGQPMDAEAYRCPNCRVYFCFKCRARVAEREPQFQCADQSCPTFGKLVCSSCAILAMPDSEEVAWWRTIIALAFEEPRKAALVFLLGCFTLAFPVDMAAVALHAERATANFASLLAAILGGIFSLEAMALVSIFAKRSAFRSTLAAALTVVFMCGGLFLGLVTAANFGAPIIGALVGVIVLTWMAKEWFWRTDDSLEHRLTMRIGKPCCAECRHALKVLGP